MEMRLIVSAVCIWLSSCQNLDQEDKQTLDQQSMSFMELSQESKAVLEVKDYLLSEGHEIDSLYVYSISYSDSLCSTSNDSLFTPNPIEACFAIFNIEHKINHDYYLRISKENARIMEENQGKNDEDWLPLIVPSRPKFLKKEILLCYYFEQDSVVDFSESLYYPHQSHSSERKKGKEEDAEKQKRE